MLFKKLFIFAGITLFGIGLSHSTATANSEDRNTQGGGDPCAPCGEINFPVRDSDIECNSRLLRAESFADCRAICEDIARPMPGPRLRRSKSANTDGVTESCRCLCKSLKLQDLCPKDSCSGSFRKIQCQISNGSQHGGDNQGVQRCFEREFESEEAYNDCVASGTPVSLDLSMLDSPDLSGGVEQCDCVCKYIERTPAESCKPNSDCTLNSRIQQTIRLRISDNGTSFADCTKKCLAATEINTEKSGRARSPDSSSDDGDDDSREGPRKPDDENKKGPRLPVTSGDCECYCSQFHEACPKESPTITDSVPQTTTRNGTDLETLTSRSSLKPRGSFTQSRFRRRSNSGGVGSRIKTEPTN